MLVFLVLVVVVVVVVVVMVVALPLSAFALLELAAPPALLTKAAYALDYHLEVVGCTAPPPPLSCCFLLCLRLWRGSISAENWRVMAVTTLRTR